MHVFLTGATGFVGTYVLRALVAQGHTARCLLRDTQAELPVAKEHVERVKGDLTQPKTFAGTLRGCDAVIHLVGIIQEDPSRGITFDALHHKATRHVVDEATDAGVERFVYMSANGARADGVSAYQTTKWEAEEYVAGAGFSHWVILRPSLIFGEPQARQPEFCSQLVEQLIKPFPILPIFGDGQYQMQPISVQEVAEAFVQALTLEAAHSQRYCVAGKDVHPYTDVLDRITKGFGLDPKYKFPQPIWLARPLVEMGSKFDLLPITPDQFEMLIEGNTCDATAFYRDFDVTYIPFTPENLAYLQKLK